jgi:hypothetical protein
VKYTTLCGPILAAGREHLWKRLRHWRLENETTYTISFLYQMFFVILRANNSVRGEDWKAFLEFKFLFFMLPLPLEVIFPQIEITAAPEAVLSFQCILLEEPG